MYMNNNNCNIDSYYDILNVSQNASYEEIKRSFRKLSLQNHPDKGGQKEIFTKINEAYQTLCKKESREKYDQLLKIKKMNCENSFETSQNGNDSFSQNNEDLVNGVKHMFYSMFSQKQNEHILSKPVPIIKDIHITLEQSFNGTTLPIQIERWVKDGENTKYIEQETIYVDIHKGIDNNELIIIRGKGNIISDVNKGDVKIFVKITEHTHFTRSGLDLIYNHELQLKEALCGFSFNLKYFNNRSFNITNYDTIIQDSDSKVIQGLGMERNGNKGNLIIQFKVIMPKSLTKEQKKGLLSIL
jgi:DnaJ-class molecular chaperone